MAKHGKGSQTAGSGSASTGTAIEQGQSSVGTGTTGATRENGKENTTGWNGVGGIELESTVFGTANGGVSTFLDGNIESMLDISNMNAMNGLGAPFEDDAGILDSSLR